MPAKWISVEERLPERGPVVGLVRDDPDHPMDWDDRLSLLSGYDLDGPTMDICTHWILLPEPPDAS